MIVEKPIAVPLMSIEEQLDFLNRPKLSEEEKKALENKLVKPSFPEGFDISQWEV